MIETKCKGCAHYVRTPLAVNDIGGGAYETACGLGKEDEFFTEEGCSEYVPYAVWIYELETDAFHCSLCNGMVMRNVYRFCPWCGASMIEAKWVEPWAF